MYILNQGGYAVCDSNQFYGFEASSKTNVVFAVRCNGTQSISIPLGKYNSLKSAQRALDGIFCALRDGEIAYEMPQAEELEYPSQYHATITNRKASHGGS